MPSVRSDPTSMMMYPDRRSASSSVPYSQMTRMGTPTRVEPPASGVPTLAWSVSLVACNVMSRIESRDEMVNIKLCFIGYPPYAVKKPLRCPIPPRAGLLLPSLNVHAGHKKPHGQQSLPEDAGGQIIGGQVL